MEYKSASRYQMLSVDSSTDSLPNVHEWRMSIEDVLQGACLINGDGPSSSGGTDS